MADPQLTMVELLVRHGLLPRERLPQIEINLNVYITKPVEEPRFLEAIRQLGLFMSIVQLPTGLLPVTPH